VVNRIKQEVKTERDLKNQGS